MSGSARGVRSNAHSYRYWGEGLGNDPSYPALKDTLQAIASGHPAARIDELSGARTL